MLLLLLLTFERELFVTIYSKTEFLFIITFRNKQSRRRIVNEMQHFWGIGRT